MAFLDETGLETLWGLIKAEDAKEKVVTGTITTTSSTGGSGIAGSATLPGTPKMVFIQFLHRYSSGDTHWFTPIMAAATGEYVTYKGGSTSSGNVNMGAYGIDVTIDGTYFRVGWVTGMNAVCNYIAFM